MGYTFTTQERNAIEAARLQCPGGNDPRDVKATGNWVPFYTVLSNILTTHIGAGGLDGDELAKFKGAKRWVDIAIGANGGSGMHSAFIRTYTDRQGELRLGSPFSDTEMQKASNGVALNLYLDITGRKPNSDLPPWTVPTISQIAGSDASSIGQNLFAGIEPSVGSKGDSYDNALAETINGLYKAEVIHRRAPWKTKEAVELATLEWVAWFNNHRLMAALDYLPPAEFEANYYRNLEQQIIPV